MLVILRDCYTYQGTSQIDTHNARVILRNNFTYQGTSHIQVICYQDLFQFPSKGHTIIHKLGPYVYTAFDKKISKHKTKSGHLKDITFDDIVKDKLEKTVLMYSNTLPVG